jgi:hypothetical protein
VRLRGAACSSLETTDTTEGRAVFYTLIFAGLAILVVVAVIVQRSRKR